MPLCRRLLILSFFVTVFVTGCVVFDEEQICDVLPFDEFGCEFDTRYIRGIAHNDADAAAWLGQFLADRREVDTALLQISFSTRDSDICGYIITEEIKNACEQVFSRSLANNSYYPDTWIVDGDVRASVQRCAELPGWIIMTDYRREKGLSWSDVCKEYVMTHSLDKCALLPSRWKNRCFYLAALETGSIQLCEETKYQGFSNVNQDYHLSCIRLLASWHNDTALCERLPIEQNRVPCLIDVAAIRGDYELCSEIPDPDMWEVDCWNAVALESKNPKNCRDDGGTCHKILATQDADPSYCDFFEHPLDQSDCVKKAAVENRDTNLCRAIWVDEFVNSCERSVELAIEHDCQILPNVIAPYGSPVAELLGRCS